MTLRTRNSEKQHSHCLMKGVPRKHQQQSFFKQKMFSVIWFLTTINKGLDLIFIHYFYTVREGMIYHTVCNEIHIHSDEIINKACMHHKCLCFKQCCEAEVHNCTCRSWLMQILHFLCCSWSISEINVYMQAENETSICLLAWKNCY